MGHEVVLLQILSRDEIELPYRRDLEFADLESGRTLAINAGLARREYTDAVAAFLERWRSRAGAEGFQYSLIVTDTPPARALRNFLLARGGCGPEAARSSVFWLNPAALFALAAVAAPILIHLLIQRRAERFPFPTLRFLQPTRLAAIRRHLLEDLPLLAVRVALLAAAVAALAGPLLVTAARRQAWDRRIVRAIVREGVGAELAPPALAPPERADQGRPLRPAPHQERTFAGPSLDDGIRRAIVWLDAAPPARREIGLRRMLPTDRSRKADVAAIPADVGVRFGADAQGTLPATHGPFPPAGC